MVQSRANGRASDFFSRPLFSSATLRQSLGNRTGNIRRAGVDLELGSRDCRWWESVQRNLDISSPPVGLHEDAAENRAILNVHIGLQCILEEKEEEAQPWL